MNILEFRLLVIGYQKSFFQTSSCIINKQRVMLRKCYEHCIVYLFSYRVSGVFISYLFLYNL